MSENNDECVVLFADITDSTRLYDRFGDSIAKENIDLCVEVLEQVTKEYQGTLIKKIGDEILCTFLHADDAYLASCQMHERVSKHRSLQQYGMTIQIGFHLGSVIKDNSDIFGDTVNVAARVTSLASANKTLITGSVVEHLAEDFKGNIRSFDRVYLKGKQEPLDTWEVLWKKSDNDMTIMVTMPSIKKEKDPEVVLSFDTEKYILKRNSPPFVLGRGDTSGICVDGQSVSRIHIVIEYSGDNFVLTDKSTNGSYFKYEDGKTSFLKHGHLSMTGKGIISLGEPIESEGAKIISFCCS